MIFALFLSIAFGAKQGAPCSKLLNRPLFHQMNEACSFAGSCVNADASGPQSIMGFNIPACDDACQAEQDQGQCECANPWEPDNIVFEKNGSAKGDWLWGIYHTANGACNKYWEMLSQTITYLLHIETYTNTDQDDWVGNEFLKCKKGSTGYGAQYSTDAQVSEYASMPDLLGLVQVVINDPEYWDDMVLNGNNNYKGLVQHGVTKLDSTRGKEHCKICSGVPPSKTDGSYTVDDYTDIISGVKPALAHLCTGLSNSEYWIFGDEGAGGHFQVTFITGFASYYDRTVIGTNPDPDLIKYGCVKADGTLFVDEGEGKLCQVKTDHGSEAKLVFNDCIEGSVVNDQFGFPTQPNKNHHAAHFAELLDTDKYPLGSMIWEASQSSAVWKETINGGNDLTAFGWTGINFEHFAWVLNANEITMCDGCVLPIPTVSPTQPPSPEPTPSPTPTPTPPNDPDCFKAGYTHKIEQLVFTGISEGVHTANRDGHRAEAHTTGCRQGLEYFWPGGKDEDMCKSPYVICLPQENTPNVGFPMTDGSDDEMYFTDSHKYSLEECKRECAYDQRCTGFEFWTETGQTGRCSLIDDIEIEIGTSAMPAITTETQLLSNQHWNAAAFNGGRICYTKNISKTFGLCHPYFGQDQLEDVMLNCYCPNNRKGFYTKKVHRTAAASVYCGDETANKEVTKRIREAQANRMFHLCENWCLFNTQSPRTESWYHDPWRKCWREQYAGVGTHRSYCYRVIRDPFTIEQYFIDKRSQNLCGMNMGGRTNTPSPTFADAQGVPISWVLANEGDSCDDACAGESLRCDAKQISSVHEVQMPFLSEYAFNDALDVAQYGCGNPAVLVTGEEGWAHPSVMTDGTCVVRNSATVNTGCNVSIGVGYQRVCACV